MFGHNDHWYIWREKRELASLKTPSRLRSTRGDSIVLRGQFPAGWTGILHKIDIMRTESFVEILKNPFKTLARKFHLGLKAQGTNSFSKWNLRIPQNYLQSGFGTNVSMFRPSQSLDLSSLENVLPDSVTLILSGGVDQNLI